MIDVVFNDSTKAAIKIAKNYKKENMLGGTFGFIGTPPNKEMLEEIFQGEALGGNPNDVIGIPFCLDIGDISKAVNTEERKDLIYEMLKSPHNNQDDKMKFDKYWEDILTDLSKFEDFAKEGEPIRIWYSDAPYSICGFYFVNSILCDYNCKVTAIKLPRYEIKENGSVASYCSWIDINAGKYYKFTPLETEVSMLERRFFASEWNELKSKNGSIRAVVNGKLTSVAEDFYDYFIRINMPDDDFIKARLIGKVLGRHQLGIGDWWISQRIEKMIKNGELEVVSDNEFDYEKILRKSKIR